MREMPRTPFFPPVLRLPVSQGAVYPVLQLRVPEVQAVFICTLTTCTALHPSTWPTSAGF